MADQQNGRTRMRYIALENTFPDHPKTLALQPNAAWLYVCGLCWCDKHRTDGFIPDYALLGIAPNLDYYTDAPGVPGLAEDLVDVGLWERGVEANGKQTGWWIHDYLKHQLSKTDLLTTSEKRALAGKNGGLASGRKRSKAKQANPDVDVEVEVEEETSTSRAVRSETTPREAGNGTAPGFQLLNPDDILATIPRA